MGIFGALTTAVSGLQAQSFALQNISGNIANSATTGYKRTDTAFEDLVLSGDLGISSQTAGSVQAFSRQSNDVQGTLQASSSGTSIAVNGSGYFVVQDPTGQVDGKPSFGGGDLYTRRGDFTVDKNGYIVNGSGYYLKGLPVDPKTGNTTGDASQILQLSNDFYPASATTSIDYRANIPTTPKTANYVSGDESSWLLGGGVGDTVTAANSASFIASTISGDATTVYDSTGTEHDVQFRWGKVTNENATSGAQDTWALFYQSDSNASGTDVAWTKVDADPSTAGVQNYAFDSSGALVTPSDGKTTISNLTIDGKSLGDITLDHGTGLTQYADTNGAATTKQLTQNGVASGDVVSVGIDDGGLVNATYSNGKSRTLFKIPVVGFYAENQLAHVDGGAYAQTVASGEPIAGEGAIVGSALEESNVDIADEFSKMIVTQQAYSANTRVVTTSDSMMQDTLQMIR
ncbi:MAG: flagellar hook protein FlgE [Hansschlegelia sp.]